MQNFKVGDRIKHKKSGDIGTVIRSYELSYMMTGGEELFAHVDVQFRDRRRVAERADRYELVWSET